VGRVGNSAQAVQQLLRRLWKTIISATKTADSHCGAIDPDAITVKRD
jgi:hypothetical protein